MQKNTLYYHQIQYITLYETKNGVLTSLNNPELLSEYKEKTQNLLTQRAFTTWVFENDFVSQNYNDSLIKGMVNVLLLCLSLVVSLDDVSRKIAVSSAFLSISVEEFLDFADDVIAIRVSTPKLIAPIIPIIGKKP